MNILSIANQDFSFLDFNPRDNDKGEITKVFHDDVMKSGVNLESNLDKWSRADQDLVLVEMHGDPAEYGDFLKQVPRIIEWAADNNFIVFVSAQSPAAVDYLNQYGLEPMGFTVVPSFEELNQFIDKFEQATSLIGNDTPFVVFVEAIKSLDSRSK